VPDAIGPRRRGIQAKEKRMRQLENWLNDEAFEGNDNEPRGPSRGDADRPSMEGRRPAPSYFGSRHSTLGHKVRRATTAPARTWRRLLSMLALPCVLTLGAVAHAEQPAQRWSAQRIEHACSVRVLQGAGYRDMQTRFPPGRATNEAAGATPLQTSYRDFAGRQLMPVGHGSFATRAHAWPRYSLRPTQSCG
jgi:hypothetical protein